MASTADKQNLITTTKVQQMLEENFEYIKTIQRMQEEGRAEECIHYQKKLQENLTFLAKIADAQPAQQGPAPMYNQPAAPPFSAPAATFPASAAPTYPPQGYRLPTTAYTAPASIQPAQTPQYKPQQPTPYHPSIPAQASAPQHPVPETQQVTPQTSYLPHASTHPTPQTYSTQQAVPQVHHTQYTGSSHAVQQQADSVQQQAMVQQPAMAQQQATAQQPGMVQQPSLAQQGNFVAGAAQQTPGMMAHQQGTPGLGQMPIVQQPQGSVPMQTLAGTGPVQ